MAPPSYQTSAKSPAPAPKAEKPKKEESPSPPAGLPPVPGDAYALECKYEDVPFTDCDPFHLVKWRQMKLLLGGSHCESYKNETERCSAEDFPPGTLYDERRDHGGYIGN